jgi:hypothetical protein
MKRIIAHFVMAVARRRMRHVVEQSARVCTGPLNSQQIDVLRTFLRRPASEAAPNLSRWVNGEAPIQDGAMAADAALGELSGLQKLQAAVLLGMDPPKLRSELAEATDRLAESYHRFGPTQEDLASALEMTRASLEEMTLSQALAMFQVSREQARSLEPDFRTGRDGLVALHTRALEVLGSPDRQDLLTLFESLEADKRHRAQASQQLVEALETAGRD